jgi:hypothetical protein
VRLGGVFCCIKVLRRQVRAEFVVKIAHVGVHLKRILALFDDEGGEAEKTTAGARLRPIAGRNLVVFNLSVGLTFHCLGWYTHERSFLRGFQQ